MNILAKKLYTNSQEVDNQLIVVENGRIVSVNDHGSEPYDKVFDNLSAGFFDTHINGGYAYHFTENPSVETVRDISTASLESGTAYTFPTLITSSLETILSGIASVKAFQKDNPDGGVVGMHLEGPFISVKKRGAHIEKFVRKPTADELDHILLEGAGTIKIMTVAPESFTDVQLQQILETGIIISIGHTDATYSQAKHAFSLGVNLVTHLYNAMSGLHHREPGVVGATLEDDNVYAPIILDGLHCDFGAAKVAYRAKKGKLFLISDALFLGERKKEFVWGEFDARLEGGTYVNSAGNLAGGAISLPDCVRNAVEKVGIPLVEAIDMVTARPAKVIGLDGQMGQVVAGFPAIFTTFNDGLTNFKVIRA